MQRASREAARLSQPRLASRANTAGPTLRRDHSALPGRDEGGFTFYPTGDSAAALAARSGGPLPWIAGVPVCPAGKPCNDSFGATITTFNVVQ